MYPSPHPLTKQKILHYLQTHPKEIQAFGVKRLGLFGSFVREEAHADSDVDFLVEYQPGCKTLKNHFGLLDWLEAAFEREIELVTRESLSPHIGPYIEKEVAYVTLAD